MQKSTTFSFTDSFKARLEELAVVAGKTKTAVIVDSVNAYASGTLPDKAIIERLDTLAENVVTIQRSIEELRPILTAALKELQEINKD
jgi:predicted transcriptional regulator